MIDNQRVTWTAFAILALFNIQERRRRRAGQLVNDDEVEERLGRDEQEELLGRMAEVENMVQDPNSSVLRDPAALAVVRVPGGQVGARGLERARTFKIITTAAEVSSPWMPNHEK